MKRTYLIFLLFFILILALISIYILQFNSKFLDTKILQKKSIASIYTQNNNLKIDFNLTNSDKDKAIAFSNNLGVSSDFLEGLTLTLDPNSLDQIKSNLPLEVNLEFNDKSLNLTNFSNVNLNSSIPTQNYEIATGSGRLTFKTRGSKDYDLTILDPDEVVNYATSSGKLYLSKQIEQLFPMLSKIAKITLVVKDKNVSGVILLK